MWGQACIIPNHKVNLRGIKNPCHTNPVCKQQTLRMRVAFVSLAHLSSARLVYGHSPRGSGTNHTHMLTHTHTDKHKSTQTYIQSCLQAESFILWLSFRYWVLVHKDRNMELSAYTLPDHKEMTKGLHQQMLMNMHDCRRNTYRELALTHPAAAPHMRGQKIWVNFSDLFGS